MSVEAAGPAEWWHLRCAASLVLHQPIDKKASHCLGRLWDDRMGSYTILGSEHTLTASFLRNMNRRAKMKRFWHLFPYDIWNRKYNANTRFLEDGVVWLLFKSIYTHTFFTVRYTVTITCIIVYGFVQNRNISNSSISSTKLDSLLDIMQTSSVKQLFIIGDKTL